MSSINLTINISSPNEEGTALIGARPKPQAEAATPVSLEAPDIKVGTEESEDQSPMSLEALEAESGTEEDEDQSPMSLEALEAESGTEEGEDQSPMSLEALEGMTGDMSSEAVPEEGKAKDQIKEKKSRTPKKK